MTVLFNHIPSRTFQGAYTQIKEMCHQGSEHVIFDAMEEITRGSRHVITSTADPNQFEQKYREIERRLNFRSLGGVELGLYMMAKVYEFADHNGGLNNHSANALIEKLQLQTNRDFKIRLTESVTWATVWNVELKTPQIEDEIEIIVDVQKYNWGSIVPSYILEYLDSAITAYRRGMYSAALAFFSVIVEATLRDILATRGYSFLHGASSTDQFEWVDLQVDLDTSRTHYLVQTPTNVALAPTDFMTSVNGQIPHSARIKRRDRGNGNGFELIIRSPELVDHWSSSTISQRGQRTISGLGAALDIARNRENIISAEDLTPDFDTVITTVRNSLIHLSGEALDTHLPDFDSLTPGRNYTLRDFLKSPEMVFDIVTNVPQFANQQYLRLRQQGILI